MATRRQLWVGALVALSVNLLGAQPARAEPLIPLTPGEIQYLDNARRVFSVSHDPVAFRSDGELLTAGRYACGKRDAGYVGAPATQVSPVLTQLAFVYLCPA